MTMYSTNDEAGEVKQSTKPSGSGGSTIADLSDTNISGLVSGDFLQYNGSTWNNATATASVGAFLATQSIDVFSDVNLGTPQEGDVLGYSSGSWVATAGAAGTLAGLTDTSITTPAADNVLSHNGSVWVNVAKSTIAATLFATQTLSAISDVTETTPQDGDVLTYNSGGWINSPASSYPTASYGKRHDPSGRSTDGVVQWDNNDDEYSGTVQAYGDTGMQVTEDGIYFIAFSIDIILGPNTTIPWSGAHYLRVNGVNNTLVGQYSAVNNFSDATKSWRSTHAAHTILSLSNNDYVELYFDNLTAAQSGSYGSFTIHRIG